MNVCETKFAAVVLAQSCYAMYILVHVHVHDKMLLSCTCDVMSCMMSCHVHYLYIQCLAIDADVVYDSILVALSDGHRE